MPRPVPAPLFVGEILGQDSVLPACPLHDFRFPSLCGAHALFVFKRKLCVARLFFGVLPSVGRRLFRQLSRKEVFQPHLPVRLPCFDLAPVTCLTLGRSFRSRTSGTPGSHGLTGGVYKARERIHRAVADARLLANPASWSRVADSNPN